jgi:hypothetical protein
MARGKKRAAEQSVDQITNFRSADDPGASIRRRTGQYQKQTFQPRRGQSISAMPCAIRMDYIVNVPIREEFDCSLDGSSACKLSIYFDLECRLHRHSPR